MNHPLFYFEDTPEPLMERTVIIFDATIKHSGEAQGTEFARQRAGITSI